MNRSAASLLGGFLLLTTSLLAHASAPQRAEAVVDSQRPLHTADAGGELTGLLSSDYLAPADRVMLASAPAHKQTSSKKC